MRTKATELRGRRGRLRGVPWGIGRVAAFFAIVLCVSLLAASPVGAATELPIIEVAAETTETATDGSEQPITTVEPTTVVEPAQSADALVLAIEPQSTPEPDASTAAAWPEDPSAAVPTTQSVAANDPLILTDPLVEPTAQPESDAAVVEVADTAADGTTAPCETLADASPTATASGDPACDEATLLEEGTQSDLMPAPVGPDTGAPAESEPEPQPVSPLPAAEVIYEDPIAGGDPSSDAGASTDLTPDVAEAATRTAPATVLPSSEAESPPPSLPAGGGGGTATATDLPPAAPTERVVNVQSLISPSASRLIVPDSSPAALIIQGTTLSSAGLAIVTPRVPNSVTVAIDFAKASSGWAGPLMFSTWLRRQLRERRISQRQLGMLSGVNHSTISRLLNGNRSPSLETATKIVHALRMSWTDEQVATYFDLLPDYTMLPTQRVEAALRGDGMMEDGDVRAVMNIYLTMRARRGGRRGPGLSEERPTG